MDPDFQINQYKTVGKALRRKLFGLSVDRERQLRMARQEYSLLFSSKKNKTTTDDHNTGIIFNESSDDVDAFSSSYCNPLQNEYILEMVANYLPSQDLKSCRLVCRLWGKEMKRCLSARKTLIITDEQCSEARKAVTSALRKELVAVADLCFFDITNTSSIFQKLISAFGSTLSGLQFEECKTTPKDLARLLTSQTPNLESFSFEARASAEAQSISTFIQIQSHLKEKFCLPQLKRLSWNEEFGRVRLEEIISTCPNLIELIYKNTPLPCPRDFTKLRWNSLKILKLSPRDELRDEHYLSLAALKLKLSTLTLFGVNPIGKSKMHNLKKFLKSLSSTLSELELFQHFMITSLSPCATNFESPFPVKLPKLQIMNIDFCLLNSLKIIESLTNLNTLECRSKNFKDWKVIFRKGLPKPSSTVKNLRLGSIDSKCLMKFARSFETCLILEVDGEHINDEALRIIIKEFPQLEQFTISKLPSCCKLKLTDSGVTGLPVKICSKWRKERDYSKYDHQINKKFPAIYDLKKLCRLELCGSQSSLSDLSVLFGITHCTNLIILGLPSCQITDVSLDVIENRLPCLGVFELQHCSKVSEHALSTIKNVTRLLFQYDVLNMGERNPISLDP